MEEKGGPRVLVVEDKDTLARMLEYLLREEGCEVDRAGNGLEAVGRMDRTEYDAVVTDLLMPMGSGFDVIQTLRERGARTGIVVCSGYLTRDSYRHLRRLGPVEFVPKPFKAAELKAAVRRALGRGAPSASPR